MDVKAVLRIANSNHKFPANVFGAKQHEGNMTNRSDGNAFMKAFLCWPPTCQSSVPCTDLQRPTVARPTEQHEGKMSNMKAKWPT